MTYSIAWGTKIFNILTNWYRISSTFCCLCNTCRYTLIYNIVWGTKIFNFWEYVETAVGQSIVIADQVTHQAAAHDLVA